jgi:hypothetical protein
LLTTKPNNMKTTIAFLLLFNISLLLHKKPNLLESLLQKTVPKSSFANVAIFDAASNTFQIYNR